MLKSTSSIAQHVEIFGGMDGNNWIELDEKREAWEQKWRPCGGKPD